MSLVCRGDKRAYNSDTLVVNVGVFVKLFLKLGVTLARPSK